MSYIIICYLFISGDGSYFSTRRPRPEVLFRGALETVFSDLLLGRFLVDAEFAVDVATSSTEVSDSSMMFEREL
jgi:hypothetical protein